MITEQMVAAMIKDVPPNQITIILPKKIAELQKVRESIKSIARRSDEARKVFNETNTALQNELQRVQATCPHYTRDYHCDPSGGGDSYYDCPVCDMILR